MKRAFLGEKPRSRETATILSSPTTDVEQRQDEIAGSCILAAGIVFFVFNTIAEGLYPNYSVATNFLSDLGAIGSKTFLLWNSLVFVFGVLILTGMYLLFYRKHLRSRIGRANLAGITYMLPGAGAILVSLFPENSAVSVLHGVGGLLVFVFGGISAVYSYRMMKGPIRYFAVILGIVTLVMVAIPPDSPLSYLPSGLGERVMVYPYVLWLVCFGSYWASIQRLAPQAP